MYQIRTIVVTTIRRCNNRERCNNSCMNFCAISAFITGLAYAFKLNGLLSISIPLSIFIFFIEKTIDFSFHFDSFLYTSWDYLVWNNFLKLKLFKESEDRMKWNRFRIDGSLDYVVNYVYHFCIESFCYVFCLKWNNGKQRVFVTRNIWNAWMLYEFLLREIIENNWKGKSWNLLQFHSLHCYNFYQIEIARLCSIKFKSLSFFFYYNLV